MAKKVFGKANMNLAGTTFEGRQGKLWALRKAKSAYLTLRRDTKNEHDPNAVKVLAHIETETGAKSVFCIGFIPKNKAVWVANAMDNDKIVRVGSFNVVGGGKASLGVEITLNHELYEVAEAVETAK